MPVVHVDYTTKSGYERLEALVSNQEAERLRKTPFAAVQVRLLSSGPDILRQPDNLQRHLDPWCLKRTPGASGRSPLQLCR